MVDQKLEDFLKQSTFGLYRMQVHLGTFLLVGAAVDGGFGTIVMLLGAAC